MFSKFSKSSAAAAAGGVSSGSNVSSAAINSGCGSSGLISSSTPNTTTNSLISGSGAMGGGVVNSGGAGGPFLLEGSIAQQFEVGKLVANGGPCGVWKVYEGYRKSDAKEVSVFVFEKKSAEKLHKPRRRETVTELLRHGIRQLEKFRHPRLLQVIAGPEDGNDTLSFISEPVYASLSNIITSLEDKEKDKEKIATNKEYNFLEVELKYGILQLTEGLSYLHYTCHILHKNVTPSSVFITKRGTWKLAGLEFAEKIGDPEGNDTITAQPWTSRAPKLTQPDLDYIAPEWQQQSQCSVLSDMFSLGMLICAIFNNGKSLLDATHSSTVYSKQIEQLSEQVNSILPKVPLGLQEAAVRLVSKDTRQRPTAQLVALIKFFSDPVVHSLQFLDVITMKDPSQKSQFYRTTLIDVLPSIPKKLWFLHVWPTLQQEMRTQEVLAAVLQPILKLISEISTDEYENIILPHFRSVFTLPKSIQATVTLMENIQIIIDKTPSEDIDTDILPIVFAALESNTIQVQVAAIKAATTASHCLELDDIRKRLLPRTKLIYENNPNDVTLCLTVLGCLERTLDKLERATIIDDVLPILYDIKLQDAEVAVKVVNIYRMMLSDRKFGLSVNQMANRVLPSLVPLTVSPSFSLEPYCHLMNTIHEMLELIDKQQRNKLKLDNLTLTSPGIGEKRLVRHQLSSDSMNLSPFPPAGLNARMIPDPRMSSSAEDFLSRRGSSDNELMMPPKIRIAHPSSAASSPGDPNTGSLPIRRHSSIGAERIKGTACVNLSPPTGAAIASNSRSVPMLLTPGSGSNVGSRRQSTCSIGSFGGFDSRRSSVASIGSPGSTFKTSRRSSALTSNASSSNLLQQLSSGVVSTVSIHSIFIRCWCSPRQAVIDVALPTTYTGALSGQHVYLSPSCSLSEHFLISLDFVLN